MANITENEIQLIHMQVSTVLRGYDVKFNIEVKDGNRGSRVYLMINSDGEFLNKYESGYDYNDHVDSQNRNKRNLYIKYLQREAELQSIKALLKETMKITRYYEEQNAKEPVPYLDDQTEYNTPPYHIFVRILD